MMQINCIDRAIEQALASARIRYRVDGPIGLGPHGLVQRGCAERLGATPVALRPFPVSTGLERDELRRRAELLATIGHPVLCPAVDIIEVDDDRVVVASQLGPHGSLADRLVFGYMPVDEAAQVMSVVAEALARAHAVGIHHGDISAANVVFADHGPMLTDLAIPRDAASTAIDRRGLAIVAGDLIDPDDGSRSAQDYRSACRNLHDGAATLAAFIGQMAGVQVAGVPAPRPCDDPSATDTELVDIAGAPASWPATTGLVVAGAAALGVSIGVLTTALL